MSITHNYISLWELAFRWNCLDPHDFPPNTKILLDVKDTIRFLAIVIYNEELYSKLWVHGESQLHAPKHCWQFCRTEFNNSVSDYASSKTHYFLQIFIETP